MPQLVRLQSQTNSTPCMQVFYLETILYILFPFLRTASRDCTEGSSSWASAAFQVGGDVHYRTPSKSQALGKHKLSIFESVKTSKSKLRKTTSEYNDITRPPFADLVVRPTITFPADSSFDLTPPHFTDPRIDVFDSDIPFDMDRLSLESQDVIDLVSHDYLPGFISGLDDCSSLPELTDVG